MSPRNHSSARASPLPRATMIWRYALRILAAVAFFLILVTFLALARTLDAVRAGDPAIFFVRLGGYVLAFLPWIVLAPSIYYVARSGALARRTPVGTAAEVAITAFCCAAIIIGHIFLAHGPISGVEGGVMLRRISFVGWTVDIYLFGLCYLAGRSAGERALKDQESAEREAIAVRLLAVEKEAADLEAREFRHRFSSHFVLNALNNILGLVRGGDPEGAERGVLALGEILKGVARAGGTGLSPMHAELDFLAAYLRFQKIRYPNADFAINVQSDLRDAMAPTFLLQPLVENAFKHGMSADGVLSAKLDIRRENGRLLLTVSNTVPAMTGQSHGERQGLELTRARLRLTYGQDFSLHAASEGGDHPLFVARIDFPERPAP